MTRIMKPDIIQAFEAALGPEHGQVLFDALPGVQFFVKDRAGRYMRVNRALLAAHGFARAEEVLGRTDHEFIARHLADHYVKDDQAVLAGQTIWNRVELVLRHQGCPDWFVTAKVPLRSKTGEIIGLAGVSRHLREAAETLAPYSRLAAALEHIREHYAQRLEVSALARMAHLSTRQFQRAFVEMFQMTPTEYVRQFRLGQAVELLIGSDRTLTDVALETGFSDHSHLSREFTRQFGLSPGAYRRKYRASGEA
jgi:PAS domain S-box-containing protein